MILAAPYVILPPERPAIVRAHDLAGVPSPAELRRRDKALREGTFPFPFFVPAAAAAAAPPTASLWGWWDAQHAYTETSGTPTTLITADATTIGSLIDRSGNGRHLYIAGSGVTHETNEINSLSAVKFTAAGYLHTNSISVTGTHITSYLIFNATSWTATKGLIGTPDNETPHYLIYQAPSSPQITIWRGASGAAVSPTLSAWHMVGGYASTSSTTMCLNADAPSTAGISGGGTTGHLALGAFSDRWFVGLIAEALVYTADHSAMTSGDALLVRQYLNAKYALGLGI